ncbi:MAG: glutamate racemase [Alphaproteobacteria bacterium]|nr:glutamate racemase [Alphaproteobacteria bacterium]
MAGRVLPGTTAPSRRSGATRVFPSELPIGVFDSGVGGLTVLAALRRVLPEEHLLYLGDTARVPYGTRAPETVLRYAEGVAGHLLGHGIKALVVACNTATTWALPALERTGRDRGVPVVGVIRPGVDTALRVTQGRVAVIGTEGTVQGGRYAALLDAMAPQVTHQSVACPLFVALAEEGWTEGPVARLVAQEYLGGLRDQVDTVILGCTHYPLLRDTIADVLPGVTLVDSAESTAHATAAMLTEHGLLRRGGPRATEQFLVTDNLARFERVGERFLGRVPSPARVVDLAEADHALWHAASPEVAT